MAKNIYMRSIIPSSTWVKLADVSTIVDATIVVGQLPVAGLMAGGVELLGGDVEVSFRIDGGVSVLWPVNVTVPLRGVDLSRIEVNGSSQFIVLVIGTTR